MRIWHYELLPHLPNSQLLAQKREYDMILKKMLVKGPEIKHILINYIYNYSMQDIYTYYYLLEQEFKKRKFKGNFDKYIDLMVELYHIDKNVLLSNPFEKDHNLDYLLICYFNLREKYLRGQKDFDYDKYLNIKLLLKREKGENN